MTHFKQNYDRITLISYSLLLIKTYLLYISWIKTQREINFTLFHITKIFSSQYTKKL